MLPIPPIKGTRSPTIDLKEVKVELPMSKREKFQNLHLFSKGSGVWSRCGTHVAAEHWMIRMVPRRKERFM